MNKKQTFELPDYLSPEMNNYEIFLKKRREIKEHLDILEEQEFCLNLQRFFNIYPNIEELTLTSKREDGFLDIKYWFKGDAKRDDSGDDEEDDHSDGIDDFFSTTRYADIERLEDWNLEIQKDNIEAAWVDWMGDENYQKWNAQVTEEKLLKIVDSEDNQPKQKIKRI